MNTMERKMPESITEIVNRVLDYLKDDDRIDMVYLNNELMTLNDSIDRIGIKELEIHEIGILLEGIKIMELQLKAMGLVSHLLKGIKDSIYDKTV
jgi:hypothetical protein